MNEIERIRVNRCFGSNCPQNLEQQKQKEQKIKEVLTDAVRRKRANREIDALLKQFRGKRIIDLLRVIKLRIPNSLTVALERVERKQYKIGSKDAIFLAEFKASLDKAE